MDITFEPVTKKTIETYIAVGKCSYIEHYLHLWKNGDPTPFFEENLTHEVIENSLKDPNQKLFTINAKTTPVGILHLSLDTEEGHFLSPKNVLLNKIYLLKAQSGKGIGKESLDFVQEFAEDAMKKVIWLYTMKKGKALNFYLTHGFTIVKETELWLPNAKEAERPMWILSREV